MMCMYVNVHNLNNDAKLITILNNQTNFCPDRHYFNVNPADWTSLLLGPTNTVKSPGSAFQRMSLS